MQRTEMTTAQITPRGRFDLGQSITFGFGQRDAAEVPDPTGPMRLGFVLDGYDEQVGVAVSQLSSGSLALEVTGGSDLAAVQRQVARVLSVDVDSTGWDRLGADDPLIGALQRARPGLRPPLFYSAYEALAWAVLSARRPRQQMSRVRSELSAAHGATLEVAGRPMPVLPTPRQLLGVAEFPGLTPEKIERLHGVARAALEGLLDTDELRSLPVDEATARLRTLAGIGPFYAELAVVRALGHTDVVPSTEPQLLALAGELLGTGRPLTAPELHDCAEHWRPWRTWACVAIRAAGAIVLETTPQFPETTAQPSRASAASSRAMSSSSV
jgi:DNA-3-methyladenine glycosylase II